MAKVVIASALARWLTPPAEGEIQLQAAGASVGAVLEDVFRVHPGLRGYVLDERGAVRRHVALFVDGDALQPKSNVGLAVREQTEIYVMQALSGG
jgi:molybdopterin synthase sulfur carrier subunit